MRYSAATGSRGSSRPASGAAAPAGLPSATRGSERPMLGSSVHPADSLTPLAKHRPDAARAASAVRRIFSDQARPERMGDGGGTVAHAELLVDVLEVRPHRGGTDDELFGDPGTAQPRAAPRPSRRGPPRSTRRRTCTPRGPRACRSPRRPRRARHAPCPPSRECACTPAPGQGPRRLSRARARSPPRRRSRRARCGWLTLQATRAEHGTT
jgi:hypothetical protein